MSKIPQLKTISGKSIPILGQGTWEMAVDKAKRDQEIEALRTGLDLGMTMIDTAEIYGSEDLVGEAISGRRKEVYLVTKIHPKNATASKAMTACEASLKRLKTDYIDLYLLHWREAEPLDETFDAFLKLKRDGKILDFGVSNFDVSDMQEAMDLPGGDEIITNQVLYNFNSRNIESGLMQWCTKRNIFIMAYTPFGKNGELLQNPALKTIADKVKASPSQVALAWVLRQKGVVVIPKASSKEHVIENYEALNVHLSAEDLKEIDRVFKPPVGPQPLQFL